jgi:DNA-binding MarR family transcriptional regulator
VARRGWDSETAVLQEAYSTGALIAALVNAELRAGGVDPSLFSFLGWVSLLEPVTPGELASETGMPPTTIRDYLRRLTDRGHVKRAPNPADGRSYLVKLTPDGRRIVARGRPLVGAVFRRMEPHLARPAEEYVERSRELRHALAIARETAAARR